MEEQKALNTLSLYGAFRQSAVKTPDAPCILYFNREFTYQYVLRQIDKTANLLTNHGIKKGDIITTVLPNIPQAEFLIYGANKIGAVMHLLHPLHSIELLTKQLDMTESKFVFAMDTVVSKYLPLAESGRIKLFSVSPAGPLPKFKQFFYKKINKIKIIAPVVDFDRELKCENGEPTEEVWRDIRATSFLFNGSGTNGKVNTIEFSDFAANSIVGDWTNPQLFYEAFGVKNFDGTAPYVAAFLPFFHFFGYIMMHVVNSSYCCNLLIPQYSRSVIVKYLKKGKMNHLRGGPTVFTGLLNYKKFNGKRLQDIRSSFVGGDNVSHVLIDEYDKHMIKNGSGSRLLQGYGPSESGAMSCFNKLGDNKHYTCGKPPPCAIYRIFDEKTKKLKTEGIGELYIGGDCLFNGYYRSPDMNKECIYIDKNGERYLKSGDIMEIDKDGYVTFVSRIKRVIKISGFSVFPGEIEQVALLVAGVRQACAIGVPDEKTGHRAVLYFEAAADTAELRAALQSQFEKMLLPKHRPSELVHIDKIPLTPYSKIDAAKLYKIYTEN